MVVINHDLILRKNNNNREVGKYICVYYILLDYSWKENSLKTQKIRTNGSGELDDLKIEFIIMVWEDISHCLATFHIKHLV